MTRLSTRFSFNCLCLLLLMENVLKRNVFSTRKKCTKIYLYDEVDDDVFSCSYNKNNRVEKCLYMCVFTGHKYMCMKAVIIFFLLNSQRKIIFFFVWFSKHVKLY